MACPLSFFFFCPFFFSSLFHVSSPSLKSLHHVLTNHIGHAGQDRSKTKAERGFGFIWFWFAPREEFRLRFHSAFSQKTANFTSSFNYLAENMLNTPSVKPCAQCICFPMFVYKSIELSTCDLKLVKTFFFALCVCVQALFPLDTIVFSQISRSPLRYWSLISSVLYETSFNDCSVATRCTCDSICLRLLAQNSPSTPCMGGCLCCLFRLSVLCIWCIALFYSYYNTTYPLGPIKFGCDLHLVLIKYPLCLFLCLL